MQQRIYGRGPRMMNPEPQGMRVEADDPLGGAVMLGAMIRGEYGREGVQRFVNRIAQLVPRAFLEQLSEQLDVTAPPRELPPEREPPAEKKREGPPIPPELLMQLMNKGKASEGGGGLDPSMLIKLLQNK